MNKNDITQNNNIWNYQMKYQSISINLLEMLQQQAMNSKNNCHKRADKDICTQHLQFTADCKPLT